MGAMQTTIQLSRSQLEYLQRAPFLPASLQAMLNAAQLANDETALLRISRETAEGFRSTFTNRLAEAGFGPDYELTTEGQILEELIDRFYPAEEGVGSGT